jgi:RHS repeat-associated protein
VNYKTTYNHHFLNSQILNKKRIKYRYSFQAQEHDDEIKGIGNSINYKYRMHDTRLGRFFAVDPLAAKYPYYSSYQFSGNRVIDMIELEGLEPTLPLYLWSSSQGFQDYGDYYNTGGSSGLMKVQNYYVVWQYANQEGDIIHKYWNPTKETWTEFIPTKPSCLSCELSDLGHLVTQKAIDIGVPTLKIAAGIIAVAAAIPTGGTSLTTLGALAVGFDITVGTYAIASGTGELTLNIANKKELAEKIPSGYLNATIGITITSMVDDKEVTETITGVLTVVEGVATYNFKDAKALQKLDNAVNITNVTLSNIKQLPSQENSDEEE